MFWNKKKTKEKSTAINWEQLNTVDQLEELIEKSKSKPVAIFKHSTRCSISSTALNRLERTWNDGLNGFKMYFLDLIAHRDISNAIAEKFDVIHESPQLIVIKNGEAAYSASHLSIRTEDLKQFS